MMYVCAHISDVPKTVAACTMQNKLRLCWSAGTCQKFHGRGGVEGKVVVAISRLGGSKGEKVQVRHVGVLGP